MKKIRKFNKAHFPHRRRLLPILIGELLAVSALSAQAATINVAANAVLINNNGVCSLIEAINNAQQGNTHADCTAGNPFGPDTINLATGSTYELNVVQNTTDGDNGLPSITSQITINGRGSTIERDDMADPFRLFHVGATGNLTLNNVNLENGSVSGSGGGVFNRGVLSAVNSTFSSNTATSRGGAINNYGSGIVSIVNSTLSNNSVGSAGGALTNDGTTMTLTNSLVSDNSTTNFNGLGGGIFNGSGSQRTLTITNSTVTGNLTRRGGGLYNQSSATLRNSTLTFNSATTDGGGIYNGFNDNLTIINSILAGNTASSDGGGLFNTGTATLTNSTLSNNAAASGFGGAIVNSSGDTLVLTNVTMANNVAVAGGSGLWSATNDIVTMNNTIIAQSAGGTNCVGFLDNSPSSNLFDDPNCGGALSNNINLDPVLMDNGGPTLTHALLANSSAINAGDAAVCASDPILRFFDQRGFVRNAQCDIGAYEFQGSNTNRIGVRRGNKWLFDINGNGKWDNGLESGYIYTFGLASDQPIVGDWNGDGFTEIGVKRGRQWFLDYNGSGKWESGQDRVYTFGLASDKPIAGDWDGDGTTEIGVKRGRQWFLDYNGNGAWNSGDRVYTFGLPSDQPVTGDWDKDGADEIGAKRGNKWYLDASGNGAWGGGDQVATFGNSKDQPVAGDWNDDGFAGVGVKRGRAWYLDRNANDKWDNCVIDTCIDRWGLANDLPISGRWKP